MKTSAPSVLVVDVVRPACTYRRTWFCKKRLAFFPAAMLIVSANWQFKNGRCKIIAHISPVEPRVAHKDNITCGREQEKTNSDDPVRTSYPTLVTRFLSRKF